MRYIEIYVCVTERLYFVLVKGRKKVAAYWITLRLIYLHYRYVYCRVSTNSNQEKKMKQKYHP
jgi:hypothetical protein